MLKVNDLVHLSSQYYQFTFEPKDVLVTKQQIEKVLGYKSHSVPDQVEHTIVESLKTYRNFIEPQASFILIPIIPSKQSARIGTIDFNMGPIITAYLNNSTFAAVFVVTIGSALESIAGKLLKEDDYLKGYVLDAVASEAVEFTCDLLETKIAEIVKKQNFSITNRYSPGYCNWPVSEQKKLFSLLPQNPCGISLTESSLMTPVKSVSGIIGVGEKSKKMDYSCSFCGLENCYKKKEDV